MTTPRLISARDLINSLHPAIEQVFLIGDYFHNYPSTDYDFYFKNTTRLDNAKVITDGFKMPVHLGFGNHDYDVKRVSREMSHRLFEAKFSTKPYSVLDYKGYKFIHLNNFLGSTQDHTSPTSILVLGPSVKTSSTGLKPAPAAEAYVRLHPLPGRSEPGHGVWRLRFAAPSYEVSGDHPARRLRPQAQVDRLRPGLRPDSTMSWPLLATTPTPTCSWRSIRNTRPGAS